MKNSKILRMTSAILATVIVGTTFFAYFRVPAGASVSLNNIENIKASKQNSGAPFKIVEIAPNANYGAMGYYVPGQEAPVISKWIPTIANMDDAAERISYSNNVVLATLEGKKLLSYTDQTPLTKIATPSNGYEEHYPWDADFYTSEYYKADKANQLHLNNAEKFSVKGVPVPYTQEDQENGVSKQGYAFNMGHTYTLINQENLFNFNNWYEQAKSNWNNDGEFHQLWPHAGAGSFTPTEADYTQADSIKITMTDEDEGYIRTAANKAEDHAIIPVEEGKTYTLYLNVGVNPEAKAAGSDELYDLKAKLNLYGYVKEYNDEGEEISNEFKAMAELEFDKSGWQSYTFTAAGDKFLVEFGALGRGSVTYSGIQFFAYTGATHIQNVEQFVYGDAPSEYSANLFNPNVWVENIRSQTLSNKTAGDELIYDRDTRTITIKSDDVGSGAQYPHDIFTGYGERDAYFMNADPGATYEVTYDVKVTGGGNAQFHIFPYKSGLSAGAKVTFEGGLKDFAHSYSGTKSEKLVFTVDNNTVFLKLRFGVTAASTTAEYSNVRIRKVSPSTAYYYDIEQTDVFYQYSNTNRKLPSEGTSLYTKEGEKFVFAGVYSPTDRFGYHMETGKDFYSVDVKAGTFPSTAKDDAHPYYAVSSEFTVAGNKPAYFSENDGELTYVGMDENGNGNGSYKIDLSGSRDLIVNSEYVYYLGGFVNNNWFKYKVLDADEKRTDESGNLVDFYTFPIVVEVIEPDDPALLEELRYADLIVISSGLNLEAAANGSWNLAYSSAKDIPADNSVYDLITQKVSAKDAVVVDKAILSNNNQPLPTRLSALVTELTSERTAIGGVKGSIYVFSDSAISQSDSVAKTLANQNFCTTPGIISSASSTDSPYYPVREEIDNENDVRNNLGNSPLINNMVNEATCIRYVLNYKNQRIYHILDKVTVLDIEPCSSNPSLTLEKLNRMMPATLQYSADDVEIIGMSVAEFVAKNEDFAENYDIVYIGASTDNMSRVLQPGDSFDYITKDGVEGTATIRADGTADDAYSHLVEQGKVQNMRAGDPVYNDPHMNGMFYTNVGDIIETANKEAIDNSRLKQWTYWINPGNWGSMASDLASPPALGGMLKEDYFNLGDEVGFNALKTVYIPLGGHASMRSSGFDLNEASMQRLKNYADTGRPLIIDDALVSKGIHDYLTAYNYCDELTPDYQNGGYSANFHCRIIKGDVNYDTIDADIKAGRLNSQILNGNNANADITVRYQWYYDEDGVSGPKAPQKLEGKTEKDCSVNVSTSSMEPVRDSSGNIIYDTKTRTRKILWWTRSETYKVPRYRTVTSGIGDYYCVVDFSYHGFTANGNATNRVNIKMGGTDYFVARLFANVYFDKNWLGNLGSFQNATFWVEFHSITPEQLEGNVSTTYNSGDNITDYILKKYKVKFEYWDEEHDWGLLCQNHEWAHNTCGKIPRVLRSPSDYTNFNDWYYTNGNTQAFSAYCNHKKCKQTFYYNGSTNKDYIDYNPSSYGSHGLGAGLDNRKLTAADSAVITYSDDYLNSHTLTQAGVINKAWNRAIVRMKFTVGGQEVVLQSAKPGGSLATVLVSRCTGPETSDEKHDDYNAYHFGELYGAYHYKNGSLENTYELDKNGNGKSEEGTNMPEYIYQIAEVDKTPVKSDPVRWRVDTDSEASSANIDNCSYMWRLIVGEYYEHDTVFCYDDGVSEVDAASSKLASALKTPRPEIEMLAGSAPEYAIGADSESLTKTDSGINLTLKFKINEPTETFKSSKYHAYLYIDQDGDGKFKDPTYNSAGEVTSNGERLNDGGISNLSTGTAITYTTGLNPSFKGIIPWKLYIEEEHDASTGLTADGRIPQHMTHTGYAYVKPTADDPMLINAVMILPGAWNPAEWTEYGKPYLNINNEVVGHDLTIYGRKKHIEENFWSSNVYMGTVFGSDVFDHLENPNTRRMTQEEFGTAGITFSSWDGKGGVDDVDGYYHLGFVVNEGDIKIMITCMSVHMINQFYGLQSGEGFGGTKWRCPEAGCDNHSKDIQGMYCPECGAIKYENNAGEKDLFTPYDMMILGFGDSYGKLAATFLDILGNQVIYQEGLSNYSALAIRNFIRSDKNILFCHDTTSKAVDFLDLFVDKLKRIGADIWSHLGNIVNWVLDGVQSIFGVGPDWRMDTEDEKLKDTKIKEGYWNNIVLREDLGLDRYGITEAIITRSDAIVSGDVDNEDYASILRDPFANAPLGRAHMYNYIYNGYQTAGDEGQVESFTARDLTVKKMLSTDHSIAWVPGTANVYGRNTENPALNYTTDSNGVKHYENEPILDGSGNIHADFDRYAQGFTDYTIARYINPNDMTQQFPTAATERFPRSQLKDDDKYQKIFSTEYVTQVNGGKITTYPYNINIGSPTVGLPTYEYKNGNIQTSSGADHDGLVDGFLHSVEDMNQLIKVKTTHEQVYQCNMNGDDITVWYSLAAQDFWKYDANKNYIGIRNDAANAYYMYSRGNVTYTGAGHTNEFTEFEAMLFINTLVASYRDTFTVPSVTFRNKNDSSSNKYILASPDVDGSGNEILVPESDVFFKVLDNNVGTSKTNITYETKFYYIDPDTGAKVFITDEVQIKDDHGTLSNTNVPKQKLLHFAVPDSILELFENNQKLMAIKIYILPIVHIKKLNEPEEVYEGMTGWVEIRRLDMSNLG